MNIDISSITQWIVTAVAGIFSWLMFHYSRSFDHRFSHQNDLAKSLSERIDKLDDKVSTSVPKDLETLRKDVRSLDDKVNKLSTELAVVKSQVHSNYDAFINRLDRLENNLPEVITNAFYKIIAEHPLYKTGNKND